MNRLGLRRESSKSTEFGLRRDLSKSTEDNTSLRSSSVGGKKKNKLFRSLTFWKKKGAKSHAVSIESGETLVTLLVYTFGVIA